MHNAASHETDPRTATVALDTDAQRLARVYAEALLNVAEKHQLADEILHHLDALIGEVFRRRSDIANLFTSGVVARGRREQAIRAAFEGRAEPIFVNFLLVLNRHDRLDLLRAIALEYRVLREERARRMRVFVRSAVPLTDDQREQVKGLARDYYNYDPVLVESVDPELIGGLRVQIGNHLLDATLRTRLETLKNQLIARSSYEIQRRRDRFRS